MYKKLIALWLAIWLLFCLSACGSTETNSKPVSSSDESQKNDIIESDTTKENDIIESDTTKEIEHKLSDNCDRIIYSYSDNEDYYEFVVDEEIAYPKTSYKFGVILNNEWLVEMSQQSPLLNTDNTWKSLEDVNSDPLLEISFEYLGEGCFLYYVDYYNTNINSSGIVYNPSKNISFPIKNLSYYQKADSLDIKNIVRDSKVIGMNNSLELAVFDTNTGEYALIGGHFKLGSGWKIERLQGCSEGLFMATIKKNIGSEYITGIFDFNGNLVINLGQYGYLDRNNDYRFYNGESSFTATNDIGVEFDIVIDKSGKIISQKEKE